MSYKVYGYVYEITPVKKYQEIIKEPVIEKNLLLENMINKINPEVIKILKLIIYFKK